MEYQNFDLIESPSWLSEGGTEQDFCYGAEASTSQLPSAYLTPPGPAPCYDLNMSEEWMEAQDGYRLDTFGDLTLPDNSLAFDLDDLFADLHNPAGIPAAPKIESNPANKITIRLKKVKRPKSSKLSREKLYEKTLSSRVNIADPSPISYLLSAEQTLDEMIFQDQLDAASPPNSLDVTASPESFTDFTFQDRQIVTNDRSLTLQDALSSQNADKLLEHFLTDSNDEQSSNLNFYAEGEIDDVLDEMNSYALTLNAEQPEFELSNDYSHLDLLSPVKSVETYSPSSSADFSDFSITSPLPETLFSEDASKTVSSKKELKKSARRKLSEDKRYTRKKEQNKEAALKYRNKKKLADIALMELVEDATRERDKLKERHNDIEREVYYLKKLLRETFLPKSTFVKYK